ncbi:protein tyrosine phosphatase family protein [Marinomonas spartinae]|uniref:protein tyrosine phosphatase family protein n=1 Tax=Marinomonas spartinae TaxID=1792290 RepID=UPI0018F1C7DF|nr:protein tyrosine phosphatase family protein [Marinomonas spartinae]MBJ7555569.1 protein tyrosine phosphatase family protein [Marinomonas spartinae]
MERIKNFVQLTPLIATGGQPKAEQFPKIAEQGYDYVINLGMPDHPDAVLEEDRLVSELGMNYIHIPVKFDAPSKKQVAFFCQLLSSLNTQKIFVHCIMNYRVSAFMYHYFTKVEKRSEQASKSIMFERWDINPVWQDMLKWSAEDLGLTR